MKDKKRTSEILIEALNILSSPAKWTQGAMARDADSVTISAINPDAICWCLDGALYKAAWELGYAPTIDATMTNEENKELRELFSDITHAFASELKTDNRFSHVHFNNDIDTTYQDVTQLLENTITHLKNE